MTSDGVSQSADELPATVCCGLIVRGPSSRILAWLRTGEAKGISLLVVRNDQTARILTKVEIEALESNIRELRTAALSARRQLKLLRRKVELE